MKYVIYARVSPRGSDYETETSINMQIQICKDFIASQNGEVTDIIFDEFYSGKDMKRPGLQRIIKELEEGKAQWDAICIYKLSRLTRSSKDGSYIFDLLQKWHKGFVSATEPNFDFSTPIGRMCLSIFQAFNQFEREQTAENTRNKMISIAAAGGWPSGKPPFGYRRGEKHDNTLYIDPRAAEVVKGIFADYISSLPMFRICRKYEKSTQTILYILRNHIYTGKIYYADKIYQGKHEPIISQELFDKVQNMLPHTQENGYRMRPKKEKRVYLLAGLLKCECGRFMTPSNGKSGQYFYYRCTDNLNCKNHISAPKIEQIVLDILRQQAPDEAFLKGFLDEIEDIRKAMLGKYEPEIKNITAAIQEAKAEQEKLYSLFLKGAVMSNNAQFFNDKLAKIQQEITDLTAKKEYYKAQSTPENITRIMGAMENIVNDMVSYGKLFSHLPENCEELRKLIAAYVRSATVTKEGKITLELYLDDKSTSNLKNGNPVRIRT